MTGQSILICGPPHTRKSSILKHVIKELDTDFNDFLTISTDNSRLVDGADLISISAANELSPEDLTGIGIEISNWLKTAQKPNLITLENLSTLLMYHNKEVLFRFLHIISSRLESSDTPFICIEETTEDSPNVRPHTKIFDYIVYTRIEDGNIQFTVQQNNSELPKLTINPGKNLE